MEDTSGAGSTSTYNTPTHSQRSWFQSTSGSDLSITSPTELSSPATDVSASPIYHGNPISAHAPPPMNYWKSPYATIPLPSSQVPITLHHALRHSQHPPISWSIQAPPHSALCSTTVGAPGHWTDCCATTPGQNTLVLRAAFSDKPIFVHSRSRYHFVSIGDVLDAVHREFFHEQQQRQARRRPRGTTTSWKSGRIEESVLGRPASDGDWPSASGGGEITSEHDLRCAQTMSAQAPTSQGVRWGGLTESPTEKEVWILLCY